LIVDGESFDIINKASYQNKDAYLNKHQGASPSVMLNHLYKFSAPMMNKNYNPSSHNPSFAYFDTKHNSESKMIRFQVPSTGSESITTATSKRKISGKFSPSYKNQSPTNSR